MKKHPALSVLAVCVVVVGCGRDAPTAPPDDPDPGNASVASVTITQEDIAFGAIASSVALQATARDSSGAALADVPLTWSVDGNAVVRVDSAGVLTSLGTGTDTVRVVAGPASDFAGVRVSQVPVGIQLQTPTISLSVILGSTVAQASVVDSMGNGIPSTAITWSSTDPGVIAVDQTGRLTAMSEGTATVTAASGSLETSRPVTVRLTGPLGGAVTGAPAPCSGGQAAALFPCDGIDLLSYLPIGGLGGGEGVRVNDLWGWTDRTTGHEYALVGKTEGVAFVDVTDPINPVFVGQLPRSSGSPPSAWRDLKVYNDHVYIIADGAGSHGMQVFDLSQLRGHGGVPMNFSETARYTSINSVHNLAINTETGFAYAVGSSGGSRTCGGGLHMINLQSPQSPQFVGCFADVLTGFSGTGYTHDVQCILYDGPDADYQGREICFGLNENALSISDVSDKAAPVAVSRASYPNIGYAHQGWVSDDRRYLYSNDELDELQGGANRSRTMIWDIADLDDPILAAEHFGPTRATDHNLYIKGTRLYQSNYQFGIRVLDIDDPVSPVELGFFDTAPSRANAPGFDGSWSNYPFFDSGILVVTSWDEGLFVLRLAN